MFCFEEDNKIISRIENRKCNYGTGQKLYLFGLSDWLSPLSANFPTSKLSYYFYIVKKYVRYNNVEDLYTSKTLQRHITGWTTLV